MVGLTACAPNRAKGAWLQLLTLCPVRFPGGSWVIFDGLKVLCPVRAKNLAFYVLMLARVKIIKYAAVCPGFNSGPRSRSHSSPGADGDAATAECRKSKIEEMKFGY